MSKRSNYFNASVSEHRGGGSLSRPDRLDLVVQPYLPRCVRALSWWWTFLIRTTCDKEEELNRKAGKHASMLW